MWKRKVINVVCVVVVCRTGSHKLQKLMHAARNIKGRRGKEAEEEWERKRHCLLLKQAYCYREEHVSVGLRFQSALETGNDSYRQ